MRGLIDVRSKCPSGKGSRDRIGILLVGPGPGAEMCEAEVFQSTIDRIVRHRDAELLMQPHDQIAGSPAHHAMDGRDRAFIYNPRQKGPVLSIKLGWRSWGSKVNQAVGPVLVEADHPVSKRLAVHPANLGRLCPRGTIKPRSDRQQPTRLPDIPRPLCKPTDLARFEIPTNPNRLTHGKPPPFANLNQSSTDLGIPSVSQPLCGLVLADNSLGAQSIRDFLGAKAARL